jgi:hypothetical protein
MSARVIAVTVLGGAVAVFAVLALDAATTSCGPTASSDPGDDAYMKVAGAQFVRGPLPSGSANGPSVLSINLVNSTIYPNFTGDAIAATLAPAATVAAVGLQGDVGYWLVVAGVPSFTTPTDPSLSANASFSAGIIAGQYTLVVEAADGQGNFGPPSTDILTAVTGAPTVPVPVGQLVVTLTWDNDANLDLHVVDPSGQDLYWGEQSTQPPFMFQQVDGGSYGTIDYDSNANCVIDGLDQEDAVWKNAPPSGQYTVRVDAASLCGEPVSYWTVTATLEGTIVGQAQGVAVDADTRGAHGPGSGVTAFTFVVP